MNLPPFAQFPILKAADFLLRPVQRSDIKDLMEISFYDGKPARTLEEAVEMQQKIDLDYQRGESIHWCIVHSKSNEVVGTTGYYRGFEAGTGELGCVLRQEFRGKGIMTTALKMAAQYGLNTLGLRKVKAITTRQNTPAIKLLERLNFSLTASLEDDALEYTYQQTPE